MTLSMVLTPEEVNISVDNMFTSLDDFQGSTVRVTAMPWSNFVNGDRVDRDSTHVWDNFWGYEVYFWGIKYISGGMRYISGV